MNANSIRQLVQQFYDNKEESVPRIVDTACEEVCDIALYYEELCLQEEVKRKEFEQKSLARVEKIKADLDLAIEQRDAILKIANVRITLQPGPLLPSYPVPDFPPPPPPSQPQPPPQQETPDNSSEYSGDDKGRWIQPGTTYKVTNFLSARIAEIDEGTRTSPTASITWKGGRYNPHHLHTAPVISFWQANGPMTSDTARARWASTGGQWDKGGLRGVMRELIKQQILVPV
jgi:hypothetical protein